MQYQKDYKLYLKQFLKGWRLFFLIIISVSFLLASQDDFGNSSNLSESIGILVLYCLFVFIYFYFYTEEGESRKFQVWLWQKHPDFEEGKILSYQGYSINKDTQIRHYSGIISYFLSSTVFHSRPLLKEKDRIFYLGLFYSLVSLIVGWWQIPFGPYLTIRSLVRNLKGGEVYTIEEMIILIKNGEKEGGKIIKNMREELHSRK